MNKGDEMTALYWLSQKNCEESYFAQHLTEVDFKESHECFQQITTNTIGQSLSQTWQIAVFAVLHDKFKLITSYNEDDLYSQLSLRISPHHTNGPHALLRFLVETEQAPVSCCLSPNEMDGGQNSSITHRWKCSQFLLRALWIKA